MNKIFPFVFICLPKLPLIQGTLINELFSWKRLSGEVLYAVARTSLNNWYE